MKGEQRLADHKQRAGIRGGSTLPQGHDRQEAEQADADESTFNEASRDIAERQRLVRPLEQREQHDGAADVADDQQQFQECPMEDAAVRAGTSDVVVIAEDWTVDDYCSDRRDEGEDEEDSHDERGLPR